MQQRQQDKDHYDKELIKNKQCMRGKWKISQCHLKRWNKEKGRQKITSHNTRFSPNCI